MEINLAKSEFVYVGSVNNVDGLANILGCGVSSLRLKYLTFSRYGMVLLGSLSVVLVGWKRMYLSKGGRITLIKSTLSNLRMYFMAFFLLGIANCIISYNQTSYGMG